MLLDLLLLALAPAGAASLDNLEIGGPWGTPTADDATAAWWNPAGVAHGRGTRLMVEASPTFATVDYERTEPNPDTTRYTLAGVVPFVGVASDAGVRGLGIGAALALPFVRGGTEYTEPAAGRWAMRDGDIRGIVAQGVAAWEFDRRFAIGASAGVLLSQWAARVDNDTLPDLASAIEELNGSHPYTDEDLENPDYATTLEFETLQDVVFTWSLAGRAQVHDRAAIGVMFRPGVRVDNTGDVSLLVGCPPQEDTIGRFGAEHVGLCDTTLNAAASVGYDLPWRLHAGLAVQPTDPVRLELMGGVVHWADYADFDIVISEVAERNPDLGEQAIDMVEQTRQWARANETSFWGGVDAKVALGDQWLVGARVLYDKAAVPDEAVSGNNYDADDLVLSGLVAVAPVREIQLGLSYSGHVLETRSVTESAFGMTLDESAANEDRWFYPHANGTYSGVIHRVGVAVRGHFGQPRRRPPPDRPDPRFPR